MLKVFRGKNNSTRRVIRKCVWQTNLSTTSSSDVTNYSRCDSQLTFIEGYIFRFCESSRVKFADWLLTEFDICIERPNKQIIIIKRCFFFSLTTVVKSFSLFFFTMVWFLSKNVMWEGKIGWTCYGKSRKAETSWVATVREEIWRRKRDTLSF